MHFDFNFKGSCSSYVALDYFQYCGQDPPDPVLYYNKSVSFQISYRHVKPNEAPQPSSGFVLRYSFHDKPNVPERLSGNTWQCSVPHWPLFQQHLLCNLETECARGEDEVSCSYTDLSTCGQGKLSASGSCFHFHKQSKALAWNDGAELCSTRQAWLPSLTTPKKWEDFIRLLRHRRFERLFIGLSRGAHLPYQYRYSMLWADGTVAYYLKVKNYQYQLDSCAYLQSAHNPHYLLAIDTCNDKQNGQVICEDVAVVAPQAIQLVASVNVSRLADTTRCPRQHVVHSFLACDHDSDCWPSDHRMCDPLLYKCTDGLYNISYTLVCDHHKDCLDNSDESFCSYLSCPEESCRNEQCVPYSSICDGFEDCKDSSDEQSCPPPRVGVRLVTTPLPPGLVEFDGKGNFVVLKVGLQGDSTNASDCPESHFSCPGVLYYCLPVHVRCNGVNDCPGHHDEANCEDYRCPGFYRCRHSSVCLHDKYLCDGIAHCPQRDDELMCGFVCPQGCTCYGHVFYCTETFNASKYKDLRVLSTSHTSISLSSLTPNSMLLYLSLTHANIRHLGRLHFDNLLYLDLSDNDITIVTYNEIRLLKRLKSLSLKHNPLQMITINNSSPYGSLTHLASLQLTETSMTSIDAKHFSLFPNLDTLNLSNAGVTNIEQGSMQTMKFLRMLDLRGCPVTYFPENVFFGLGDLQLVYADNYKLCCPEILPSGFNTMNCHAPSDEVSSCGALLQSEVYRVVVCVFASLILIGNFSSFVYRVFINPPKKSTSFAMFVTHLCVSDFLMGVYTAIIGVADRLYQGTYLWNDVTWRNSAFCKMAGFLSLTSGEVSALIVCLITLDRFLVIRFPFRSELHLTARSARVAMVLTWLLGVTLASVPLLPAFSHWRFYSQTGVCATLPITRKKFAGHMYSFSIIIILNFALFLLIAAGQASIYLSIRANTIASTDSAQKSKDLTIARRLITVVMSDFLCWFPVGLLGLLASGGTPIPGEVNVAIAMGVLPLNSALNPFLYTVNVMLDRRRRVREEKLKRLLLKRPQRQEFNVKDMTRKDALRLLKEYITSNVLSGSELMDLCLIEDD